MLQHRKENKGQENNHTAQRKRPKAGNAKPAAPAKKIAGTKVFQEIITMNLGVIPEQGRSLITYASSRCFWQVFQRAMRFTWPWNWLKKFHLWSCCMQATKSPPPGDTKRKRGARTEAIKPAAPATASEEQPMSRAARAVRLWNNAHLQMCHAVQRS